MKLFFSFRTFVATSYYSHCPAQSLPQCYLATSRKLDLVLTIPLSYKASSQRHLNAPSGLLTFYFCHYHILTPILISIKIPVFLQDGVAEC